MRDLCWHDTPCPLALLAMDWQVLIEVHDRLVGDKEKYLKMGFDGYLSKPFRTNELIDEMVRVMPT